MPRDIKRVRVQHIKTRAMKFNKKEFTSLFDTLYEALKGNRSQMARLLGISRPTLNKWMRGEPPEWPWWNTILRLILIDVLAALQFKGGANKKHRRHIKALFEEIPAHTDFTDEIVRAALAYTGAEQHLLQLLSAKGMYKDHIFKAANCGGYSRKALELAASKLNMIKGVKGFGKDKRSYWRLPNIIDYEDTVYEGDDN